MIDDDDDDDVQLHPMRAHHQLKVETVFFDDLEKGTKSFEIRENDRDYAIGDILHLCEWRQFFDGSESKGAFTGRKVRRQISYMLGGGQYGIEEGWVVLALRQPRSSGSSGAGGALHAEKVVGMFGNGRERIAA